nr:hypothetical protein Iba_chr03cCG0530 [Ipomoea batatas]
MLGGARRSGSSSQADKKGGDGPTGRMNEGVGPKTRLIGMKEEVNIGALWVYRVGESVKRRNR